MSKTMVLLISTCICLSSATLVSAAPPQSKKQIQHTLKQKTNAARAITKSTRNNRDASLNKFTKAEKAYNNALIKLENANKASEKAHNNYNKARTDTARNKARKKIAETSALVINASEAVRSEKEKFDQANKNFTKAQIKHANAKSTLNELETMKWRTFRENQKRYKTLKIAPVSVVLSRLPFLRSARPAEPNTEFTPM